MHPGAAPGAWLQVGSYTAEVCADERGSPRSFPVGRVCKLIWSAAPPAPNSSSGRTARPGPQRLVPGQRRPPQWGSTHVGLGWQSRFPQGLPSKREPGGSHRTPHHHPQPPDRFLGPPAKENQGAATGHLTHRHPLYRRLGRLNSETTWYLPVLRPWLSHEQRPLWPRKQALNGCTERSRGGRSHQGGHLARLNAPCEYRQSRSGRTNIMCPVNWVPGEPHGGNVSIHPTQQAQGRGEAADAGSV